MSYRKIWILACTLILQPGCGTVMNMRAPPSGLAEPSLFLNTCAPFGGTSRSAFLGILCLEDGIWGVCTMQDAGKGGLLRSVGIGAFGTAAIIDTPISFAGDIVTMPIAAVRSQGQPWATWWGNQGWEGPRPIVPPVPLPITSAQQKAEGSGSNADPRSQAPPGNASPEAPPHE